MNWAELDTPTRVGFVATVMAVLGILFPPVGPAFALVAIVFSAIGWQRSRSRGETNRVAQVCTLGCAALLTLVVVGSVIYAGLD